MIRLRSIAVTNEVLLIDYVDDSDIHDRSGIVESRVLELPHHQVPRDLFDDLVDAVLQIIDNSRAIRRLPPQEAASLTRDG